MLEREGQYGELFRSTRDNQEFYGRRYAGRELVWEEISQEESEDYYAIQLSYRPSRGFAGMDIPHSYNS